MLRDLVWRCHVCGAERPDAQISVLSRERMIGRVAFTENVRYCNDNPACIEGAKDVSFVKGAS